MENTNQFNIENILAKAYGILKMPPDEIKIVLNDLGSLQRAAVLAELIKGLNEAEIKELAAVANNPEDRGKLVMEKIAVIHKDDADFGIRAQGAAKGILNDHINYLKTQGDDAQKAEIAKILAEIA